MLLLGMLFVINPSNKCSCEFVTTSKETQDEHGHGIDLPPAGGSDVPEECRSSWCLSMYCPHMSPQSIMIVKYLWLQTFVPSKVPVLWLLHLLEKKAYVWMLHIVVTNNPDATFIIVRVFCLEWGDSVKTPEKTCKLKTTEEGIVHEEKKQMPGTWRWTHISN